MHIVRSLKICRRMLFLETYPQIYDLVEGPMQRSLALTPPPAATLSCSPSESPLALRENRRFSPASAGKELTAGDLSQRTCELRKVPCNVRWRSLLRLRLRCPVLQANRLWLFGRTGDFPRLQPAWKMRQQGAERVGAPKVRYPSELADCLTGCKGY